MSRESQRRIIGERILAEVEYLERQLSSLRGLDARPLIKADWRRPLEELQRIGRDLCTPRTRKKQQHENALVFLA